MSERGPSGASPANHEAALVDAAPPSRVAEGATPPSPGIGVTLAIVGGAAVVGALFVALSTGPNAPPAGPGTKEDFSSFFALLLLLTGIGAAIAGAVELDSVPAGVTGQLTGAVIAFMGAGVFVSVDGQELTGSDIGVVVTYAFGGAFVVGLVQTAGVAIARRRRGGRRPRRDAV